MLNLPGWLIQPPPRSNQATKTGSAQLRSREKGLNTQPRPFNLCESFWQWILKLWYSISERIIYISLLELLQLAEVHGWWSSQLQWWRFFTMFLLSNSTPKSSMQNKQNKTRENKKNTHCCWNSYKADLRTMQQLQSTVVTICQGINGNNHEFICKVFDSFGVFVLDVMASPHRLWKLRNLMASTKMAAKKTAQPTSTAATIGRKLCLNPKLVWM